MKHSNDGAPSPLPKTLRNQRTVDGLTKALTGFSCLVLLLGFFAISLYEHQHTKGLADLSAQHFTEIAALKLAKPMALDNAQAISHTLEVLIQKNHDSQSLIKQVCIYNPTGDFKPIAAHADAKVTEHAAGNIITLTRHCPSHSKATLQNAPDWYFSPITLNTRNVGSLWVEWPQSSLSAWLGQRTGLLAALSTLIALSFLWIKQHVRANVIKPVQSLGALIEAARRTKDFSALPEQSLTNNIPKTMRGLTQAIISLFSTIQENEDKLREIAFNDPLTSLPNRRHFWEHLTVSLHSLKRNQRPIALIVIDLDGFKCVNDRLGHEIGDKLLAQVSQAMRTCIRQEDFLARLGGDEFTLILRDCDNPAIPKRIAQKILKALDRTFAIGDENIRVGASMGIALAPQDSRDPQELTRFADKAMYVAKSQGKGCYAFWHDALNQLCDNLAHDEKIVLKALEHKALSIQLTPQHRFDNSRNIIGVQAHPTFTHADSTLAFEGQTLSRSIEEVIMQSDSPKLLLGYHNWFFTHLSELIQRWKKEPQLAKSLLPITLTLAPHKLQLTCFVHAFKDALRQGTLSTADVIIQMHEHTLNRLHHLPIASLADPLNQKFFSELQVALTIEDLPDAYTILNKAPNILVKRLHLSAFEQNAAQLAENMQFGPDIDKQTGANNIFKFAQSFGCEIAVTHIDEASTFHQFRKLGATIGQGTYLSHTTLASNIQEKVHNTNTKSLEPS